MKKFKDSLNTAVFTTKFVVEDRKLITYVAHDEDDGAWQFLSSDDTDDLMKVAMLVGLGEIIKIDKTILELADLPYGYFATRNSITDQWLISKKETEE